MRYRNLIITLFFFFLMVPAAYAATENNVTLSIPSMEIHKDKPLAIPILVQETDNLAGVKLILTYDKDVLLYKGMAKSKETSAMMHVVNDKQPGRLIIVMATAQGIKGKNFPLAILHFMAKQDHEKVAPITITLAELMSDTLKTIPAKIKQ